MSFYKFIFLSAFLLGCKDQKTPQEDFQRDFQPCGSKVVTLLSATNSFFEKRTEQISNHDELKTNLIIEVDNLTRLMIDHSGGANEDGSGLFNGCENGEKQYEFYMDYLNKNIYPFYEQIKRGDNSETVNILEINFFSSSPYFSKSYFQNSNMDHIAKDLLIVELQLINKL